MAEPIHRNWTVEEFFAWQEEQNNRYELVDGRPLKMRTGAKNVHDDIVVNIVAELRAQLRGAGCRPFTGDGSVETRPGQIRRRDVGVDCGRRDPNGTTAALPKAVIEVLSPSTRDFESFRILEEYKGVEPGIYRFGGAQRGLRLGLVAGREWAVGGAKPSRIGGGDRNAKPESYLAVVGRLRRHPISACSPTVPV